MTALHAGGIACLDACVAAGGMMLFTSLNPLLGGVFGATHAVVTVVVGSFFASIINEMDFERNHCLLSLLSGAVSATLTVGIAALALMAAGIPFTLVTMTILFLSLIVSSAVVSVFFFCE